eukprot:CAMPEP_0202966026 /NCGR_PEP_ID=MMETSP1396-20130829/10236_1 /ASSEMBLY_ACC=CAM_ASM_000872 /TAXON_ID= /ORGANISM="Pseudokeronopsis sp., Strain Brazil" /LENGTH=128 /DNA_ID=CAMNT_0049689373 /DNA_START=118 /DNA_END=501 /DNA_ORIENTATION=+
MDELEHLQSIFIVRDLPRHPQFPKSALHLPKRHSLFEVEVSDSHEELLDLEEGGLLEALDSRLDDIREALTVVGNVFVPHWSLPEREVHHEHRVRLETPTNLLVVYRIRLHLPDYRPNELLVQPIVLL